MMLTAGEQLRSVTDTTAVVVIRAPDHDVMVTCGGAPMVDGKASAMPQETQPGHGGGTQLGKRYEDAKGTLELLCTKGGTSSLAVDGIILSIKAAKPLPASD